MVKVVAPGKLMLSGEWSVLELGNPCIVIALNKNVEVEAKEAKGIEISSPGFGIKNVKAKFLDGKLLYESRVSGEQEKFLVFVKNSIETALKYLQEKGKKPKGFNLSTKSDETVAKTKQGRQKIGFGSSAAVTVATIAAVIKLHGNGIESKKEKESIFKLACIAHFLGQGKVGSSFDVAASTFGGLLKYTKFDAKWLEKELAGKSIAETVEEEWPSLSFENLSVPKNFCFVVGFSGKSASTKELVEKMKAFKENDKESYQKIMNSIKGVTEQMANAIKKNDSQKVMQLVHENRKLLKELAQNSGNDLETKELTEIIETANNAGGAAKFSGAGGGDCAIAVCFDRKIQKKIMQALKEKNITLIKAEISLDGVRKI